MKLENGEIFNKDINTSEINEIKLHNITIENLTILYKFTNLKVLEIKNCIIKLEDYNKFDFSKLQNLKQLTINNYYYNKIHLFSKDLIKNISEKLNIDLEIAKLYYTNLKKIYFSKKYFLENKDYLPDISSDFELVMDKLISLCGEFEKDVYFDKCKEIENFQFNKTIYGCKLEMLSINNHQLKYFFENLPDECNLINSLTALYINNSDYFEVPYLFNHISENKKKYYYDICDVEFDKDICKLALFPNLKNSIFEFINSDFDEYTAIKKCKKKQVSELLPINNIELYYKNHCIVTLIYDKPIIYKRENITNLKLQILDYEYAFDGFSSSKLECIKNIPFIESLILQFTKEQHDNFNSCYYSSYFEIDDNLPSTLKYLRLTGIDKEMVENIKKIPFGCILEYDIFEDKY